jgi:hypothetical protein
MKVPHIQEILKLEIYTRGLKAYVHKVTWAWMLVAALFIIAKKWK